MDEFGLIAKYFKPLSEGVPGAIGLSDDAAYLTIPPGQELVLTKDAIVAGVHFLDSDPLDLVARKLVRVNISDLAAKGARPVAYLLACCWPRTVTESDIAAFARGLAEDQAVFGLKLLGGDTTVTGGPLSLTLTALGIVPHGRMVRRSGARPGDKVFVTGTIGDAGLGLKAARGESLGLGFSEVEFLMDRYRVPKPRLAFGLAARDHVPAAIDVSDGLVADAGHIAEASGVRICLEAEKLPLSAAARSWVRKGGSVSFLASCGDDYEICFTAPQASLSEIAKAANASETEITEIGSVAAGAGICLIGSDGLEIDVAGPGFDHFRPRKP